MTAIDGIAVWTYTYDKDGLRLSRSDGTTTYNYVYLGGQLVYMTIGDSVTMKFNYDANGAPLSFMYNGTTYYYITNLQGNVVGIINQSGTQIVTYTYDAWGNLLSTTGAKASTIGAKNPLRYRGYVYDTETSLYYLQSRYYNPEIGRFINADSLIATGQGLLGNNAFAYCLNNPGYYLDQDGKDAIWIQEESNVGTMGHSGLLVQDENGQWYYFYWGMGEGGSDRTYYLIKVDVEGYDLSNIEDVIEAIDNALANDKRVSDEFRKKRSEITSAIYFEGDYSATYDHCVDVADQKYNLLFKNCGQVCWRAMEQSDERFRMTSGHIIPNLAYCEILQFKNFSVEEYRSYLDLKYGSIP